MTVTMLKLSVDVLMKKRAYMMETADFACMYFYCAYVGVECVNQPQLNLSCNKNSCCELENELEQK